MSEFSRIGFLFALGLSAFPMARGGFLTLQSPATEPAASKAADSKSTQSKPAETQPASSPARALALAFMEKAASRRAPGGEPDINDLTISFEAESTAPEHQEFVGTNAFMMPNRIKTKITNNSAQSEQGFDGIQFWIRRGEKIESLEGREYEKDRRQINDSINQTRHLLQIASLKSLAARMTGLALAENPGSGDRVAVNGKLEQFPTFVTGVIESANVTLYFESKTLDLVQIRAEAADGSGRVENIDFDQIQDDRGVRFPHHVLAWTKSRKKPQFELQVKELMWNSGLRAEDFKVKI
ncbi:MAG: hypothetical protein HY286_04025 [Planctomycetes bacterium]|nr:hypothetical protein [Planctomycetota bacterium]